MKNIGIQTPCSENWNTMTSSEKGAFCQKCASHVHDFTQKSTSEIKDTLRSLIGQPVCGRMTADQEIALNAEFEAWKFQSKQGFQRAMVFSLVVVFGLTLFSCSNKQDEKKVQEIQAIALQAMNNQSFGETENVVHSKVIEVPVLKLVIDEDIIPKLKYREYVAEFEPILVTERMPDIIEIETPMIVGGVGSSWAYTEYLTATSVSAEQELDENGRIIPTEFAATAFPNPTADFSTFELSVPDKSRFEIGLYDMNGKLIQDVYDGKIDRGTFTQELDLSELNTGIYLLIITSKDYTETVRISKI